jgi:hypothetical protein
VVKLKGGAMSNTKLKPDARAASGLSVGRKGFVRFGKKKRMVRIIEDRGKIGLKGRRILRVAFSALRGAPEQIFEIPADELTEYSPKHRSQSTALVQ